ncbi:VOC family protein [Vibrio sinensis]|uniref:VOC family protein n=1 Tax=Vibrio sinensis TaxID=2302434 RepID=A0A3A6QAN9_9VIBR|nr:VOC family protein [Vibrio sinensis]RJX65101.1 VOC family protein [Vibrio sinensis]
MHSLTPYLFFSGRCKEALAFYQHCFNAEVTTMQLFKDAPQLIEGADPEWVMHSELEAYGIRLMLSDGVVAKEVSGNNVVLSIVLDDLEKQGELFERLSHGGHIMTPLSETFWGACFGKVEDQFGVRWMLHCDFV